MAHSNNILHTVTLPNGNSYEIHDAHAIHTLADLAALGMDIEGAFIFKGTVGTVADLPKTGNKIGYVYHVTEGHSEYVWAKVDSGTSEGWEEFGEHFVINHTHDVSVTGTNESSAVTGSATVTGANASSTVTGSASIPNAPKVEASPIYTKVSTDDNDFVQSYSGVTSKMVTTSITPAGTPTSVVASVSPSTGSVTGVSGSVTASKVTANNVVITPVVNDGILSFSIGASCEVDPVTVPVANKEATTVVTGVSTDPADVATVATAVTVATGALDTTGGGASVLTGLGTATTAKALTSASLAPGTSSDGIHTGDDVTVETQTLSGSISGTAAAQTWTQNVGTISGTAAA